jgi:integrase
VRAFEEALPYAAVPRPDVDSGCVIWARRAEAGIPEFKCHPHTLKHTCGRLGFKNGMSVPDLVACLGHKNPANSPLALRKELELNFPKLVHRKRRQGLRAVS